MEEGTGASTADASGNGNTGTLTGSDVGHNPSWVAGKIGKALSFTTEGYVDWVDAGTASALLGNIQTVIFWYKYVASGGSGARITIAWATATAVPSICINYGGAGKTLLYLGGDNWRYWDTASPNINILDGAWHFIAFVITGNAQTDINNDLMYVDGVLQTVYSTRASGLPDAKSHLYIGATGDGNNWSKFAMDELEIYSVVLSSTQITSLYTLTQAGTQPVSVLSSTFKAPSSPKSQAVSALAQSLKYASKPGVQPISAQSSAVKGAASLRTQSASVVSTKFKASSAVRAQPVASASTLSRVWGASRSLAQPLTVLSTGVKAPSAFRSQPVSAATLISRKDFGKASVQPVSVLQTIAVLFTLLRQFTQGISVGTLASKYPQKIGGETVLAQSLLSKNVGKLAAQPVDVESVLSRLAQYQRTYTQPASVSSTISKYADKPLFQSVQAVSSLIKYASKPMSQSVSTVSSLIKYASKPLSQPFGVDSMMFKDASKFLSEPVAVTPVSVIYSSKFMSQVITEMTTSEHLWQIQRVFTQPISILQALERTAEYQRAQTQLISALPFVEKQPYKHLMQTITPATYISKASELMRIQAVEVPTSLVKAPQKSLSQAVSVVSTPELLLQLIRLLTQLVSIDSMALKEPSKFLSQLGTVTSSSLKQASKVVSQIIAAETQSERLTQFQRAFTQPIQVISTRTLQIMQLLTQPITVVTTRTSALTILRSLTQQVLVVSTVVKGIGKSATESIVVEIPTLIYIPEMGCYVLIIDNLGDEGTGILV